jgi:hypothetical protein
MDKYASKAPTRVPVRGTCCYSRLGKAKSRFASQTKARQAIRPGGDADVLEPYECEVHAGTYHLRRRR